MVKLFGLLLPFAFFSIASAAADLLHLHQHHSVFSITSNQTERSCLYTVIIKTSCSSVIFTNDEISLSFGDAYGNEVYAPGIDGGNKITFERCSRYVFEVRGPCMDIICYLSLMRNGTDGWKPDTVMIYGPDYAPMLFSFHTFSPRWGVVRGHFL